MFAGRVRLARLLGKSRAMQKVFELIGKIHSTKTSVLITGESGTGKELVARAIHTEGTRADKPFVAVNCGAIPEELMESELFGHKRGAFTGAVADTRGLFRDADGGTLFLDEIGELSLGLQVKLLRALQERKIKPVGGSDEIEVDVRVIAATNRDLEAEVARGGFAPRSVLSPQRDRGAHPAAAPAPRGHPAARRALPAQVRRRARPARHAAVARGDAAARIPRFFPATSASSGRTSSSARWH